VRRVRALLRGADRRAGQGARDRARRGGGGGKVPAGDVLLAAARAAATQDDAGREAVVVRGAGRAIDRVLRLAAWFEERAREEGVRVRLVTGSVCAIDDILPPVDPPAAGEAGPLPESRVRQVSVLEARISRR
jgi:ribonuclease P/MRP protein subunit POP7